jgi:hypothetical protein
MCKYVPVGITPTKGTWKGVPVMNVAGIHVVHIPGTGVGKIRGMRSYGGMRPYGGVHKRSLRRNSHFSADLSAEAEGESSLQVTTNHV